MEKGDWRNGQKQSCSNIRGNVGDCRSASDDTFHKVRSDVECSEVIGGGAGQRVAEAETRLAALGVELLLVEKAGLAPVRTKKKNIKMPHVMNQYIFLDYFISFY